MEGLTGTSNSTAPKAVGGYLPNQSPQPGGIAATQFVDHAGNPALSVYYGRSPSLGRPVLPPLWSFQFYVTDGVTAATAPELPRQLLDIVLCDTYERTPLRFDVNFLPGVNLDTCINHYLAERETRKNRGAPLEIPEAYGSSHRGRLFLLENSNWEDEGIVDVRFDPPPTDEEDRDYDAVELRQGVKVARPAGRVPQYGVIGDGPDGAGSLADILEGARGSDLYIELDDKFCVALAAGRSDWT